MVLDLAESKEEFVKPCSMRVACLCTIALMIPLSALPQRKPVKVQINVGVDTANHDIGAVVHLWQEYLNSRTDSAHRSEEHTSELQSHSFISYAVFCLKKK